MKRYGNLLGVVLAFALGAFAVPALAQNNKTYIIEDVPATINAGTNANIKFTVRNNSPAGNANFNSFRVKTPAGITILAAEKHPDSAGYSANVSSVPPGGTTFVEVTNISPSVGKNASFSLKLTLAGECGGGGRWVDASRTPPTEVWSGSNLSGQQFAATNPTIQTTVPCGLVFTVPPRNATIETPPGYAVVTGTPNDPNGTPVQAEVQSGGFPVTSFTGPVSVVVSSGPGAGSTLATVNAVGGTATFPNGSLQLGVGGTYQLRASAGSLLSAPASVLIGDGVLNCGDTILQGGTVGDNDPVNPGDAYGVRGFFNQKGEPCVQVNYDFSNRLIGDNVVAHVWDTALAPSAAFYYKLNGDSRSTFVDGYPDPIVRPTVAWIRDAVGNYTNEHPGRACLSPSLPQPYGRLTATLNAGDTTTLVLERDALAPPPGGWASLPAVGVQFPMYIEQERLTVSVVSYAGSVLTLDIVSRGDAGTTDAQHDPAGQGTPGDLTDDRYALSTPLPLNAAGTGVEQVCIVSVGWKMYAPGLYFWFVDAIDIGDGFIAIR